MRRDHIFLGLVILLFGLMFGLGSKVGMAAQRLLAGPLPSRLSDINLATLRASVEAYGTVSTIKGDASISGKTVPVYSRYPFNLKNEILIAAGEEDGIRAGDVAVFQGSILGTVEKVFGDSALVRTIFDARFKTPVRIGAGGADALLVGGPEPKLTLISKDAKVGENDKVYTSGEDLPYGTALGAIRNVHPSENSLFRDGSLRVLYNPATMNEIVVIPKDTAK